MINFDDVFKENIKKIIQIGHKFLTIHTEHLIIVGSRSGKTDSLFDLIKEEPDIDKIYLYAKIHLKQNINFW